MLQHTSPEVINRNAPHRHLIPLVHLAHQADTRVSLVTMLQRLRMPGVALGTTTYKNSLSSQIFLLTMLFTQIEESVAYAHNLLSCLNTT